MCFEIVKQGYHEFMVIQSSIVFEIVLRTTLNLAHVFYEAYSSTLTKFMLNQLVYNVQYLMFLTLATFAYNDHTDKGVPWKRNIGLHLLIISALRYLLFQLWGTATRLPTISRKYQIVKKGITFEQIDHEANW